MLGDMVKVTGIICAIAGLLLVPTTITAREYPEDLLDLNTQGISLRTDTEGNVIALDRANRTMARWDGDGELMGSCELNHPSFDTPSKIGNFAVDGKLAFIIGLGNNASGTDETMMGATIVDVATCEVKSTLIIPGLPVSVTPSPDGWIVVIRPAVPYADATGMTTSIYDNSGRKRGEIELPDDLRERVETDYPGELGATLALFVTLGNEVWMIPSAYYELWRLKRSGRSDFLLAVPACMSASAITAEDEEAKELLEKRFAHARPEIREKVSAWFENKQSSHTYVSPISAGTAYKDRIALFVTDRRDGGCRLDIWDTTLEQPVFMKEMPWDICPSFIGLADDAVWTSLGEKVYRFEIPSTYQPLKDPCDHVGK